MDNAVALVQAYLHINGYFTVAEYPVIEAVGRGNYRMMTDLDILAFRFPGAGRLIPDKRGGEALYASDPVLHCPQNQADMLVGEVKEGRAVLNHGATNPAVLRTVLARFGCCPMHDVGQMVQQLINKGSVTANGINLRNKAIRLRIYKKPRETDSILSESQGFRFTLAPFAFRFHRLSFIRSTGTNLLAVP